MLRIASDKSINGMTNLQHILSILQYLMMWLGKSLMIVPRSIAKEGFKDIDKDDYTEDDGHAGYMKRTQDSQLVIIEDKWRDDYKVRVYKD